MFPIRFDIARRFGCGGSLHHLIYYAGSAKLVPTTPMRALSTLVILSTSLCVAQSHYFTTTYAGTVPPLANPVALKQYLDYPCAVTYDAHGNLYYANFTQVWRLNPDGTDTLIAGTAPGVKSGNSGLATDATFSQIRAMAFDPQGDLYIADGGFWKMTPDQKIVPFSGPTDAFGNSLFDLGSFSLAIDAAGNLYAAGFGSGRVMKYSPATQKWTFFALLSSFDTVYSLAASGSKLYMLDSSNYGNVMQVDLQSGVVSTAFTTAPSLVFLWALASGPDGMIYAATVDVIYAGNPQSAALVPIAGTTQGSNLGDGGPASQAALIVEGTLFAPGALAVSPANGDIAFAEPGYHMVRTINGATNIIQTVAGAPHFGGDNGPAILAKFDATTGFGELAADGAGNLYLADLYNSRIRKVAPSGIVSTIAGNGTGGNSGDEGKATQAEISVQNIAADKAGNVYFINSYPVESVRMVDLNGDIHTVAGGGTAPVTNGAPAASVSLAGLCCIAVDSSADLYLGQNLQTQTANGTVNTNEILKVSSGKISIVAGASVGTIPAPVVAPDGTPAAGANIDYVGSVASDNNGLVYFVESNPGSSRIRMVNAQGNLATIAGIVTNSATITPLTQGPAKATQLDAASALVFDSANNLYFANANVNQDPQIAMIDASGTLTPVAGKSSYASYETASGDGSDSLQASFASVGGLTLDPLGNIYVLDSGVYIRKLSPYNPASPPPYLSAGGVVGAGASVPAVAAVSPNGDASIYGANFGVTHNLASADLVDGKVPTSLAGVCVNFGGVPAAILGVYPSQINVQVPALPPGPATVQITINCGKTNAITSNFSGVLVQSASPEFFTFLPDPTAGKNPIAALNALTGALIGAPGLLPGASFSPAKAGDIVEAYGTGWGTTTPAFDLGVLPGATGILATSYTFTFAGAPLPAANILYAGVAPCCAGLYQVNFIVPSGIPSGNQPLVITVNGIASPPNAFLKVQ